MYEEIKNIDKEQISELTGNRKSIKSSFRKEKKTNVILSKDQDRQNLAIQILTLLNQSDYKGNLIYDILALIKEYTGFEATGIRLKQKEDYPYYVFKGFPAKFIKAENYLCSYDKKGNYIKDAEDNPVLECMCGIVIRGRANPSSGFFTKGGSFWTNSTTELLATASQDDLQTETRNRCNSEGYESVALIPLRSSKKIIGLLQLNDRRRGMLNEDIIEFFEGVGESIGISISHRQAEERLRKSESEYKKLARQLSEANNIKDLLFDVITHDLRSAAGSIHSFASLSQEQDPDNEINKYILLSSKSLLETINNITSLSRINLGEQIERKQMDICGIIDEALEEFQFSKGEDDFELIFEPEGSLYAKVNPIISEVFKNYISNAIKYAYDGKKLIFEAYRDGDNIIVKAKDFGKTIPENKRQIIFKRSIQLNKDNLYGDGLGLAIVKNIAEAHNGEVWVESNHPKGNIFCLKLPANS
ncbi:MAG: GAF domain-containing sensor histidine kinase [Bacteroidales bacterium]|nr:MAG: GAF domain-containing sensor histidine kinase [Bacteroidales bacterium]